MALATQPYIHPKKSNRPTSPVAAAGDRHGFEVEPALAKKLRNEIARLGQLKRRRNPRPEDQKTEQKLHQKIEAKIATLQCPCPSRYSVEDAARDKQTLARLWRRRRSRAKLTAREDTALAHINARYTAYAWGPEAHGRTRLQRFGRSAASFAWQVARALARTNAPNSAAWQYFIRRSYPRLMRITTRVSGPWQHSIRPISTRVDLRGF